MAEPVATISITYNFSGIEQVCRMRGISVAKFLHEAAEDGIERYIEWLSRQSRTVAKAAAEAKANEAARPDASAKEAGLGGRYHDAGHLEWGC